MLRIKMDETVTFQTWGDDSVEGSDGIYVTHEDKWDGPFCFVEVIDGELICNEIDDMARRMTKEIK